MATVQKKDLATVGQVTTMKTTDSVLIEQEGGIQRIRLGDLNKYSASTSTSDAATAAENANAAATAANAAATAATEAQQNLQSDITGLLAAQGSYAYYAAGRVAGASSPTFTKEYGTKEGLRATLSHLRIGTIKNGEIQHVCAPGRLTLATNGDTIAIDGTDGDVCLFTDQTVYKLRDRGTIGSDTCNVIGLGLVPHLVGTMSSKKIIPFFRSADYTVNAKLDGDTRSQAHCIYNTSVAGSYSAAGAYFKTAYRSSGGGYPSAGISSLDSSAQARNKNTDTDSSTPYQGLHFSWEELWWQAMYLELGTLDITATTNFGYGCTNTGATATTFADTAMSGISGMKTITSAGAATYAGIYSKSLQIGTGGTSVENLVALAGSSPYTFLEELVHLRILDNITKNGLTSYVGNSSAVFTGLGTAVVTDGSVNLSTGSGMTANTFYCQVRNVPNCQGLADGVMTAVINMYIMLECSDNVYLAGGTTSMSGGKVIFKFSVPVYRGLAFLKGIFTQMEGMYYQQTNTDGTIRNVLWSVDDPSDMRVINTSTGYADGNETEGILKGLTKHWTVSTTGGWVKDSDYSVSLFAHQTFGAGQHSYECSYIWIDKSWGAPHSTNGVLAQGYSCVNAAAVGCSASSGYAGRTLNADNAASSRSSGCAGAFAGCIRPSKA